MFQTTNQINIIKTKDTWSFWQPLTQTLSPYGSISEPTAAGNSQKWAEKCPKNGRFLMFVGDI